MIRNRFVEISGPTGNPWGLLTLAVLDRLKMDAHYIATHETLPKNRCCCLNKCDVVELRKLQASRDFDTLCECAEQATGAVIDPAFARRKIFT